MSTYPVLALAHPWPLWSGTMRATAMPSLQDIAADAAAGPTLIDYLTLRAIRTPATLALLANNEDALEKTLIQPLFQGWAKPDGSTLEIPDSEKPIAKAMLLHMWQLSKQCWMKTMAAATPPTSPTLTTGTSAASASPADEKVPKTLASGKWTQMLTAYQSQQLGGRDRVFPVNELLGSEPILARILHEHEISKLYSPVLLGEIMAMRTFLPSGEPNPLSKKDRTSQKLQLTGDTGTLVASTEEPWQPRSVLAILDGLQSIRWAYILCNIGSEQAIHQFFDWMVKLTRSKPQKTDQVGQFWLTISWKLAMEMRSGKTFDEVVQILMKDYDVFAECMTREPTTSPHKKQQQALPDTGKAKGSGKTNTKSGKNSRFQPYQRQPRQWQTGYPDRNTSYDKTPDRQASQQADGRNTWSSDSWSSDWAKKSK